MPIPLSGLDLCTEPQEQKYGKHRQYSMPQADEHLYWHGRRRIQWQDVMLVPSIFHFHPAPYLGILWPTSEKNTQKDTHQSKTLNV